MLACFGLFVFSLKTAPVTTKDRKTNWRHARNEVIGKRASSQYVGVGSDTITLNGEIAHDVAGATLSLDVLRVMADTGEPYMLVLGNGQVMGTFEIDSIDERSNNLFENGTARHTEFSINLTRVESELTDTLALVTAPLSLVT